MAAASSGFCPHTVHVSPACNLPYSFQRAWVLSYQHLASDLIISLKTPQDDGTIFTHTTAAVAFKMGMVILRVLRTEPGHINQPICVVSMCA